MPVRSKGPGGTVCKGVKIQKKAHRNGSKWARQVARYENQDILDHSCRRICCQGQDYFAGAGTARNDRSGVFMPFGGL